MRLFEHSKNLVPTTRKKTGETILKQEGIAEITLALTFWSRGLTCRIVRSKQFMHQFQHLFQSVSRSKLASSNMEVGAGVRCDANSLLQQSLVKHNCAEVNDGCAGGFPQMYAVSPSYVI